MHSEKSVLSAQCNSSALTVCVFLFNVTNNTVIVLLVSSLLILLSILLHLLRFRRPVRLNVRLTTLYRRVSCKYRQFPRVSGEASRTCSCSAGRLGRELELEPQVVVTRPQVSEKLAGALADLFDRAAVQLAALLQAGPPDCTRLPSLWLCTPSLVNVKTVLIEGVCGAFKFTATPPSAAGACPGMNGSSSSRRSLNVLLR